MMKKAFAAIKGAEEVKEYLPLKNFLKV